MSPTLFRYIFWDLIRIFLLTSGVLSAIMNFGGLLRPLYEHGLEIGQVWQILAYAGPAMTAYSLPIAALFATTIVYGRLSADNELTGCRAAGIPLGLFGMALPALILGLITALVSIALLCFVVPYSMLKVEKIIYSNLAQLAANEIERTHQIRFDQGDRPAVTVFAEKARVLDVDPKYPRDQAVQFIGPLIVQYEKPAKGEKVRVQVPEKFYMAKTATAYLHQDSEDEDLKLYATLENGVLFPRSTPESTQQGMQVTIRSQDVGPLPLRSPVRENTKFMDIFKLGEVINAPEKSRRVSTTLRGFIRRDQEIAFLTDLQQAINSAARSIDIGESSETFRITRPPGSAPAEIQKDRLAIVGTTDAPLTIEQTKGTPNRWTATEVQIRLYAQQEDKIIQAKIVMQGMLKQGDDPSMHANIEKTTVVKMTPQIDAMISRPANYYVSNTAETLSQDDTQELRRNILKIYNSAYSEVHARLSFAVSCLILVLVGCALGMMFRSGNFLSAFAVSVIPALASIALVVTGQHTCENVPSPIPLNWQDPRNLGVMLIWSGNAVVLLIAAGLLTRLQRQ